MGKSKNSVMNDIESRYRLVLASMPTGWAYHQIVTDDAGAPVDYIFLEINRAFTLFTSMTEEMVLNRKVTDVIPGIREAKPDLIKLYGEVALGGAEQIFDLYFEPFDKWYSVRAFSPKRGYFVAIFDDITQSRSKEQEIRSLNEKLAGKVEAQLAALAEMATPTLALWDGIILMPLIGVVDTQRASQALENLLEQIVEQGARVAILDITGVPVIDTSVAHHLMKTTAAAAMLGAEVVITGISPHAAQTLVKLGINLEGCRTSGSLSGGVADAFRLAGFQLHTA